jgi:shikimate dehydrogenase
MPTTHGGRLAAVIGSPVRHSLSPVMHNAVFEAAGLDWRFVALDVVAGGVPAAVGAMSALDIGGYAVTMPHKESAAAAVDEIDEASAALNSVNTIVLRDDGSTLGASTDGAGFVASALESGVALTDAAVVVLGAGGAARSIVYALARSGVGRITVVNRTAARARRLLALGDSIEVGGFDAIGDCSLLVNATSVGMGGPVSPVEPALLHAGLTVADIVYHPIDTMLLRDAREAGARVIDGLGMLVHQAVLQQELWTGARADPTVMRAAAEAELAARSK